MKFNQNLSIATCILFCIQIAVADEFRFDRPDAWQQPDLLESSGQSLFVTGQKKLIGKKLIKVPQGKELKISGTFRAAAGTANNTVYIGFLTYDANREKFTHVNVHPYSGTDTVLIADVKKGDTFIMVADASTWKTGTVPVWGAKADRSDLPNYNLLPAIARIEQSNNVWKVSFASALKSDIAKDTGVRTHESEGYMYYTFIETLPGTDNPPRNTNKAGIWPHVHYVRFMVLANWRGGNEAKLEMIDPKVTLIDLSTQQ